MSGLGLLAARLGPSMVWWTIQGIFTAIVLIVIILSVKFNSLRIGLISLLPNALPLTLGLTAIPWLFEQIDVDTLTILPVCLGIAVDDTIHFLARYRIERQNNKGINEAIEATMLEAGQGILKTSIVLAVGFSVVMMSDYQPFTALGFILPVTLCTAVFADLVMVPALAHLGAFETKQV